MQFHRDEMKRAGDGEAKAVSKIASVTVSLDAGEGLPIGQHQVHWQRFRRVGHKTKANEIGGAVNRSVPVPLKVGKPAFGIGLAHQEVDIERRPEVGVQVDGVSAYQHRFESFGLGARRQSDAIRVRH